MDPLASVRDTCSHVALHASNVAIVEGMLEKHAEKFGDEAAADFYKDVEWDAQGWHYCADVESRGPLTVQYILVMDALNFCFWPSPGFEYDTLAVALKAVLENDSTALDAKKLANMTEEMFAAWFPTMPMRAERVRRLREVGIVLDAEFGGLAANLVASANHSAAQLVKLVLMHFPGFRDTSVYKGSLVHFYKRAQILVGDIWAAYGRSTDPTHPYSFHDMDKLTMFADYRVPQILRHMGVLQYSADLARRIDAKEVIPFGSEEETELRAMTIVAVEKLRECLQGRGRNLLSIEIDWLLWQWGEAAKDDILPHHRTLTIFY